MEKGNATTFKKMFGGVDKLRSLGTVISPFFMSLFQHNIAFNLVPRLFSLVLWCHGHLPKIPGYEDVSPFGIYPDKATLSVNTAAY
jgi:hypothetical protein